MSSKAIAVQGCVISHGTGSTISGGVFTITSIPSTKVRAEGKGVYAEKIDFTFAGGSEPTVTSGTVEGSGSIPATATKNKSEGKLVVREGDTGTLTGTGENPSPPPTTLPLTGPVEVSFAGQTKVKAS